MRPKFFLISLSLLFFSINPSFSKEQKARVLLPNDLPKVNKVKNRVFLKGKKLIPEQLIDYLSEILSAKSWRMTDRWHKYQLNLRTIIGIYQEEKKATIYFGYDEIDTRVQDGKQTNRFVHDSVTVFHLNSGYWYDPHNRLYLFRRITRK